MYSSRDCRLPAVRTWRTWIIVHTLLETHTPTTLIMLPPARNQHSQHALYNESTSVTF
jgi:hypothetical protein